MANLLASLTTASQSMKAFEYALSVVQNNVTNATTPGYVRQKVDLVALGFQPDMELAGGVAADSMMSSRNSFSERAVQQQAERYGYATQLAGALTQLEPLFDLTDGTGIPGALDLLYASFSQLTVTPNDTPTRENVIRQADEVAGEFRNLAEALAEQADQTRQGIRGAVHNINRLAGEIRSLNLEYRQDYRKQNDAGLDARLHAVFEELAEFADFTALRQADGSYTVMLGGQAPLVIGDHVFEVFADLSGTGGEILDFDGRAITDQIHSGRLNGMLDFANDRLPGYEASLGRLAAALADTVNGALSAGVDRNGLPPMVDLFSYDTVATAAMTLSVTTITPDEIAAALPGAPGGNGNALALAGLANSEVIDGFTLTEFFGSLGARVGQEVATARANEQSGSLLLGQAQYLRDQESAVNLDEEAAALLQYQRAYQASARLVTVLDELTEVVLSILR